MYGEEPPEDDVPADASSAGRAALHLHTHCRACFVIMVIVTNILEDTLYIELETNLRENLSFTINRAFS